MEWWIFAGLALAAIAVGVVSRLRKPRDAAAGSARKTIYPLW